MQAEPEVAASVGRGGGGGMRYNRAVLKFHLTGRFPPGQVHVRFVPGTRIDTHASRAAVEAAWERMSRDPEVHLFDGPMCRLEGFHVEQGPGGRSQLRLDLSLTSYKLFLGTNLHGPPDLPPETLANPVGVSPALETADGWLLFGRRSGRVAYYPHRLHPFSGSLEPPAGASDRKDRDLPGLDIFTECRRELAEELNLTPDEVPEVALLGIVEDERIRHPELILHARTTLKRDEVASRLDRSEHVALHAVPARPEAIHSALTDPAFTPVARAALELYVAAAASR